MATYIDDSKIRFDEVSAPATPSSGKVIMYAKTDGYVYTKDDTGLETRLGNSYWDYEETLGSNGAFDVTLSSITTWSSSVKSLEIEVGLRSTVSATSDIVYILLNNDTLISNYYRQTLASNSGVGAFAADASPIICLSTASTSPSGSFTIGTIYISNPNSTIYRKIAKANLAGQTDTSTIRNDNGSVVWNVSPVAITRIQIRTANHPTNLFVANSYIRIRFIR